MLKRVKIQGYKSLADVEVQLQPLSVLFGPNASGKSNFLDALQLLSRIANSRTVEEAFDPPYRGTPLESFTFGPNGIKDLFAQEKASFSLEVDVELSQTVIGEVNRQIWQSEETRTGGKLSKADSDAINATIIHEKYLRYGIELTILPKTSEIFVESEHFIALNAERTPIMSHSLLERRGSSLSLNGRPLVFRYDKDSSILSQPLYVALYPYAEAMRRELAGWFFFYLEPREHMRLHTPFKAVRHIGLMGEELAASLNTLHLLDAPQFKALEKALHMIIPSITGIDVGVNNEGKVELSLIQGQRSIPANLLSDGTLRILGLLALRGAKEAPALIGLEEPENGIHPDRLDLIALLLENLASSDTQVIATTHSPTLIDLVPQTSLYVFNQVNGNTTITPLTAMKIRGHRSANKKDLVVSEHLMRGDLYA
jgi:predicted ATPase